MTTTDNFDLKVYEGTDLFNPLTVENANTAAIDEQMEKNEQAGVQTATELTTGTVHALTRLVEDSKIIHFKATSKFTAGDTFTVDGAQVSALTTSGEQLPDGAYIIGSEVMAILNDTLLTFFISKNVVDSASNALKLGGQLPEYYGTAEDVETAQSTAEAAGEVANQVKESLTNLSNATKIGEVTATGTIGTINLSDYSSLYFAILVNDYLEDAKNVPIGIGISKLFLSYFWSSSEMQYQFTISSSGTITCDFYATLSGSKVVVYGYKK